MHKGKILVILFALLAFGMVLTIASCAQATQAPAPTSAPTAAPPQPTAVPTVPPVPVSVAPGPGLKMEITKVEIPPADNKPIVTFTVKDDRGNLVKSSDWDANSLRFGIARLSVDKETNLTEYENYIVSDVKGSDYVYKGQTTKPTLATSKAAGLDLGGKLTETAAGFTYVFSTTLPANLDRTATHVVAGYVTRNTREFVANGVYPFVPAGGTPVKREVVATETCNGCHDTLAAHGGTRREVGLCLICHTDQTFDPESGNSVDMKVMAHKLHTGSGLQSVALGKKPYLIVGYRQTVFDFNKAWSQDVRNCTTCHQKAAQADNWKNAPSRAACGSCHDGINWETGKALYQGGKDHVAGPQKDDKACKTCHPADGQEFDASVSGSHTIPARSKQLKGFVYTLDSATAKAGEKPVVEFTLKDGSGAAMDANKVDFIEVVLSHPLPDYAHTIREVVNQITVPPAAPFVRAGTLTDLGGGKFRYTFAASLDATWKGSVGVGMAVYKNTTIKGNDGKDTVVREGNVNPVVYAALDGSKATPRRAVVDRKKCNDCHLDLGSPAGFSIHGGIRRSPEYCVLCHTPNATDEAARPKDKLPPETIHLKYMVHSLHMGAERDTPTEFFGRAVARTADIGFPTAAGQRNCSNCHVGTSYTLPLPAGVLPTTITQAGQVIKILQPVAATCTACHASTQVVAHASVMTASNGVETCGVCHSTGSEFAVDKVHK